MAIPDLLTDDERIAYGFTLEDPNTARHVRYGVWRYRCSRCDLWVRKTEHVDGSPVCLRCLAHQGEFAEPLHTQHVHT